MKIARHTSLKKQISICNCRNLILQRKIKKKNKILNYPQRPDQLHIDYATKHAAASNYNILN